MAATAVAVTVAGYAGLSRMFEASSPASVLGVYAGSENVAGVRQFGQAVGVQPANAMDFLDGSSWASIIASAASFPGAWGPGYQMTWGVDMLPNSGASLASEAAGAYDANFVQVADNLVAAGQGNAIIRLGWEMNGDWFPWGTNAGSAADFVGAYQHVVTAMRSAPGQTFRFEWNPTLGGSADLASYYPGDSYVDIIAMDVYDQTVNAYPGPAAAWQGYLDGSAGASTYGLNWLASFAGSHGKQIAFPEWGLGYNTNNGGDDPAFVNDMAQWISTHDVVNALFWDDGDWVGTGKFPNSVAALSADFGPGGVASSASSTPPPTTPTTAPPTAAPPTTAPPTTAPPTAAPPTTAPPTTAPPTTTPPTTTPPTEGTGSTTADPRTVTTAPPTTAPPTTAPPTTAPPTTAPPTTAPSTTAPPTTAPPTTAPPTTAPLTTAPPTAATVPQASGAPAIGPPTVSPRALTTPPTTPSAGTATGNPAAPGTVPASSTAPPISTAANDPGPAGSATSPLGSTSPASTRAGSDPNGAKAPDGGWRSSWFGVDFGLTAFSAGHAHTHLVEHGRFRWAGRSASLANVLGGLDHWIHSPPR